MLFDFDPFHNALILTHMVLNVDKQSCLYQKKNSLRRSFGSSGPSGVNFIHEFFIRCSANWTTLEPALCQDLLEWPYYPKITHL